MAYFPRTDEFDSLLVCNMCSSKIKERRIVNHTVSTCSSLKNVDKKDFPWIRCEYDVQHMVDRNSMDRHLEFCEKRQSILREDMQRMLVGNNQAV